MSKGPYIPFYTSDFLGGVGGLTAAQRGVYITLMALIYEHEEPLPQSWSSLARSCGCPNLPNFKAAVKELCQEGKLTIVEGCIWSLKCEKHIACRRKKSSTAKKSANARWEKRQQKQGVADANAMQMQCERNANQNQNQNQNIDDTNVSLSSGPDDVVLAYRLFADSAERQGWPVPRVLNDQRKKALRARLKECGGIEGWKTALWKASASPLCNGENRTGWTASLDFLLQASSFTKLMEGNYDARPIPPAKYNGHGNVSQHPATRVRGQASGIVGVVARRHSGAEETGPISQGSKR